jgi:hypothetical protein
MPCLGTTVTVHRVGMLDLSSLTARIIPVTGNPFNINRALSPPVLGVAAAPGLYRTRDFDSLHAFTNGRGKRNQSRDDPHHIRAALIKNFPCESRARLARPGWL